MDKLDIKYLTDGGSPTVLFEPYGLIDFQISWDWQRKWQKKLINQELTFQAVWLLEHLDCYTLGRGASDSNLIFEENQTPLNLFRIDRGGEVTHHLPGQLVAYLVLDLHRYKTDLNWYLRKLESVVIDVLNELGLQGQRINGLTGVWCNGLKVASFGISCRRWVTQHGLALNVDCDLAGFDQIIPCGLVDHQIGKLSSLLPGLKVDDVQLIMKRYLRQHFDLNWIYETTI